MENINVEKEVCQLAQAFYSFLNEKSPTTPDNIKSMEMAVIALGEATRIIQAKLQFVSLNNISESLFHIGNRIYVEPPKFKNVKKD
jgi:phosphatidylinositol kinase/protein kinase (PI-3  family)